MPTRKAASTSIKEAIKAAYPRNNIQLRSNAEVAETIRDGWVVTAIVRHPLDRLVSMWRHLVCRDDFYTPFGEFGLRAWMPFPEMVERIAETSDDTADLHFRSQTSLFSYAGKLLPTWVGRFEHLDRAWGDFREIARRRGLNLASTLPHMNNTSDGSPWLNSYTKDTLSIAQERYRDDLNIWYRAG